MKKIISVLLAVLLLAAVCTVAASASEQEDVSIVGITFESDGDVCEEAYQGGATVECLFDGDKLADTTAFNTAGVLLVKNTQATADEAVVPTCIFNIELSDVASVSAINVSLLHQVQAMVGVPSSIVVRYSEDDQTYYNGGTYTLETTADVETGNFEGAKVEDVKLDLSELNVTAKYIMLTFTYGEIPAYKGDKNYWTSTTGYGYTSLEWIGLTEIGVETSAPAEESSEAPSDTSSETASGENSSSDSSAPATGDSGLTAFVVIAAAAIAFAVLAAKKRA